MFRRLLLIIASVTVIFIGARASAEERSTSFDPASPEIITWQMQGDVGFDEAKNRPGGAGTSLRLAPGSRATWKVRDADASGRVEMWVFDDRSKPTDPVQRRLGPRWGLLQSDGRVLVMGVIYAPYLDGANRFAAIDTDGKNWFAGIQYAGPINRVEGWQKWTFNFDADKGLTITMNDKDKVRLDWNKTQFNGFSGIVLLGDEKVENGGQTYWVDDVVAMLGGPMNVRPTPPPPPAPTTPATDPAPEKKIELVPSLRGQHPRLLFTAQDVPVMREKVNGLAGQSWAQLLEMLPAAVPPTAPKYLNDATDGQRQGIWRAPTVALHYVLTGDSQSLARAKGFLEHFLSQEHWEEGGELDSGMSSANIMVGAALTYDWLYNDLDPVFREAFGKKLLLMARRQYYGGHLMKNPTTAYWQQDPANNHRWHRDGGMTLAILAVAGHDPAADWLLSKTKDELDFIAQWLPADASSHESSQYQVFGAPYLTMACDAADRCLGTDYLSLDFFKNLPAYRLYTLTPGFRDAFHYADCGGLGFYTDFVYRCIGKHRLSDMQEAMDRFHATSPKAFHYGWFGVIWRDTSIANGSLAVLPKNWYFPDMGIATMRDGWAEENVGFMFKCAPYGGLKLNEYRNENNYKYVNVAHDDPDANMFLLFARGQLLADDDRYEKKAKVTSSHNTILVNGKGQKGEGSGWTQPLKGDDKDMLEMAWITARKDAAPVSVIEGEAAGAYKGLTRYRRTAVWVEGGYVLLLDDIIASNEAELTWLVQGKQTSIVDQATGRFRLGDEATGCDLVTLSDAAYTANVVPSTATDNGKSLGFQQLQLTAKASRWRVVSVFDPWKRGVKVTKTDDGDGGATITIDHTGQTDTWSWAEPVDAKSPSKLVGQRARGGFKFEL